MLGFPRLPQETEKRLWKGDGLCEKSVNSRVEQGVGGDGQCTGKGFSIVLARARRDVGRRDGFGLGEAQDGFPQSAKGGQVPIPVRGAEEGFSLRKALMPETLKLG